MKISENKLNGIIKKVLIQEFKQKNDNVSSGKDYAKLQEIIWCDSDRCANDEGMMDELNQMYDEGNYDGMIDYLSQWDFGLENGGEYYDDIQKYDEILKETNQYLLVTVDPRHYWGDRPFGLYVKLSSSDLGESHLHLSNLKTSNKCLKAIKPIIEGVNNDNYTHFAVSKTSGKIVNGWDYSGYEPSELRQFKKDYFIEDLIDYGFNPKNIRILTLKGLKREGIDPNDDNNWSNGIEDMQESSIISKIMPIVSEKLKRMIKKQFNK